MQKNTTGHNEPIVFCVRKGFSELTEIALEHALKAFAVPGFVLKPHFESARKYCVSAVFLTVDFIISHGFPT